MRTVAPAIKYLLPPELKRAEENELIDLWEPVFERHQGAFLAEHPEVWAVIGTSSILADRILARLSRKKKKKPADD